MASRYSSRCALARASMRTSYSPDSPATHPMSGLAPTASPGAPASMGPSPPRERSGRAATLVATGILLSRIAGLVRQHFLARYLGLSDAADAFNAAFRIPNFLQNLFGEGVLSASFIPVYARLRANGDEKEATRVASAVLSLLAI